MTVRALKFPEYMNMGSRGPHVSVLQAFLVGACFETGSKIVFDQEYGAITAEAVKEVQREIDLEEDGNFGPKTREAVEAHFGFHFDQACNTVPGTTKFMQPNGEMLTWTSPARVE